MVGVGEKKCDSDNGAQNHEAEGAEKWHIVRFPLEFADFRAHEMNSLGQKPDKDNYKTTRAAINWSPLGFKPVHLRCQFLAPRSGALYREESRKVQRATRV
jgi:hypothetical protein